MNRLLSRALLLFLLLASLFAGGAARAEVTYVMDLNYNGIYSVDVNTGGPATLLLSLPGGKQGYTLATRPSDGVLFFLDSNTTNPNLWRWDPNTPANAPVLLGTPGATADIVRLGFDNNDNLLAMDTSTNVWTLSTSTGGILTAIPLSGDLPDNSGDLCLDSTTGVLYMVATNQLYTVSRTGVSTLLGTITGTPNPGTTTGWITGCAFTRTGTLIVSPLQGGRLYKVNVASLAATALPQSSGSFQIGDLSTAPVRTSDLSVTKVAADANPGATASFTVTVSNAGPDTATDVRVLDPVPAGLTFSGGTASQGAYSPTAATVAGNTYVAGTWRVGRLAAGASATLTLNYAVTGTVPITNTAQVSYSDPYDPDSTPGNSVAAEDDQASATITPSPDLRLTKVATGSFAVGSNGAYTISLTNAGTVASSGLYTVVDSLPAGLTFVSGTGTGWSCPLNVPVGANISGGSLVSCSSSTPIAGLGTSNPLTLNVAVALAAAPSVTNTASVSGGGEPAGNGGNNSGSVTTPVCNADCPDLVVAKTVNQSVMTVGTIATYTLTVTNRGGLVTSGTYAVADTLPGGLTLASAPTGTGWSCTGAIGGASVSCTSTTGTTIPPSTSRTVTFNVNVLSAAYPEVTNTATVSGGGEPSATQNNNSASLTTPVQDFDLTIDKITPGAFTVSTTTNATYTMTVSNVGARATPVGVVTTVTDTLPSGLTIRSVPNGGATWSCTGPIGATTVTCTTTSSIAAGASAPSIRVGVTVGPAAAPSVTNVATVSNPQEQSALTGNNSGSATTAVNAVDLVITKSHNGSFTVGGTSNVWTLTATNIGTVNTNAVVTVTDTLPAGATLAATPTGTGWACAGGAGASSFTCTRTAANVIAANDSAPPIIVRVNTPVAGTLTNTATVSGGNEPSGNNANNSATDVVDVFVPPGFTKAFGSPGTQAGTPVQLTFTMTNVATGPLVLQGIAFVDNLPAGMTVASTPGVNNTCGGTLLAGTQTGDTQIALSGGTINGKNQSCTIKVNVVGTIVQNNVTNTTSELSTGNGGTAPPAVATINITAPSAPVLTKVTSPNPIGVGETSILTFRLTNKNSQTRDIAFVDTFPSGMVATTAAPTIGGTCTTLANVNGTTARSITYTPPAGATPAKVTAAGLDLNANANCTITLPVTSFSAGSYANTSANISGKSPANLDTTALSDTLQVQQAILGKAFLPTTIYVGQTSTVTFTITNTTEAPEFNALSFTESLPSGLTLAAAPTASQCNGTVSGTAGGSTISLTGGVLAAGQASCTVVAIVTSMTPATYDNTNANVTAASANLSRNVTASLLVQQSLPSLAKTVTLLSDPVNGTTNPKAIPGAEMLYTVTLTNMGPVALDANSVFITDLIPVNTILYVGNLAAPAGPIGFSVSTSPAAGLTYSYVSLGDVTDDVSFSNSNTAPYAFGYTPAPDGSGYDPQVTAIRLNPKGALAGATSAPYPSVTFTFKVKVR